MKPRLILQMNIDTKKRYEYCFIICVLSYVLFSLLDLLIFGKDAIQWSVLWNGNDFIADFTNVIGYSSERDPYNHTLVYGLGEKAYPPLQYVVSFFLSKTIFNKQHYYDIRNYTSMYTDTKIAMMYLIITIVTIVCMYECIRKFKNGTDSTKALTAIAIIFSFPVVYTVERGNSILAVFVFMLFYLCFYNSNNKFFRELSYISLSLAAAIKLSPAILGLLLIIEKRWKDAARTILYGILFFFLPFLFFKGGFNNIPLFLRNLSLQLEGYKYDAGCTIRGYIIKYLLHHFIDRFDILSTICAVITIIICTVMLIAAFITPRNSDRLLYLCLIMIILPSHSAAYCIIYIIPALIAFLNENGKRLLDKYIIFGGCLCLCELGGRIGFYLINMHNGLLIILICSIVKSIETITVTFSRKHSKKAANMIY